MKIRLDYHVIIRLFPLKSDGDKTKRMLVSHHLITEQTHDIKAANASFENVAQFKCFGMTLTNKNLI
jgi:hypothetical protein